jgi:tRNA A-37 threonylcarbamoyl transferase component Bud32
MLLLLRYGPFVGQLSMDAIPIEVKVLRYTHQAVIRNNKAPCSKSSTRQSRYGDGALRGILAKANKPQRTTLPGFMMMVSATTKLSENPDDLLSVRMAAYHGWINRRYNTPAFCEAVESFLTSKFEGLSPVSVSNDRKVYRTDIDGQEIYIKQYYITNLRQFVKTLFRLNKAQKAWKFGRRLVKQGINTALPIAWFRCCRFGLPLEYLLIMTGIPDSITLRSHIDTQFQPGNVRLDQKRQLIKKAADLLGSLHMAGVYHGDFTSHNIMVEMLPPPEYYRIHLIDLDAIDSMYWISSRRRIKNLDELGRNVLYLRMFSTADRARFLRHYLETYTKETRTFKQLFTEVLARTRFRLNKYGKDFIRE